MHSKDVATARIYRRNPKVELAPINDEVILFDPDATTFLMLNNTSALVWERLNEACTAEDLAAHLCGRFRDVEVPKALKDVERLLEEMLAKELVFTEEETPPNVS